MRSVGLAQEREHNQSERLDVENASQTCGMEPGRGHSDVSGERRWPHTALADLGPSIRHGACSPARRPSTRRPHVQLVLERRQFAYIEL